MGRPGLKSFAMKTVTITSFHWRIWAKKNKVNYKVLRFATCSKKIELPTSNEQSKHNPMSSEPTEALPIFQLEDSTFQGP